MTTISQEEIAQRVLRMNKKILLDIIPVSGRDGFTFAKFVFKAPTSQDYDDMELLFKLPHNWSVNIFHQVEVSDTMEIYDCHIYFDDKTLQLKDPNQGEL